MVTDFNNKESIENVEDEIFLFIESKHLTGLTYTDLLGIFIHTCGKLFIQAEAEKYLFGGEKE